MEALNEKSIGIRVSFRGLHVRGLCLLVAPANERIRASATMAPDRHSREHAMFWDANLFVMPCPLSWL